MVNSILLHERFASCAIVKICTKKHLKPWLALGASTYGLFKVLALFVNSRCNAKSNTFCSANMGCFVMVVMKMSKLEQWVSSDFQMQNLKLLRVMDR